jgi:hypothetical protein
LSEALPSVLHARERAQRYWEADGFYAIVSGIANTLFGLALLLEPRISHLSLHEHGGNLFLYAGSLLFLSTDRITEWLKAHFTYPRTGYVAPPQKAESQVNENVFPRPKATREEIVDGFLIVTYILLFFGVAANHRWMIGLFVLLYSYLCWHFRNWVRIRWYKKFLPPIIGTLLLVLLTRFPMDLTLAIPIINITGGLLSTFRGLKKMALYLRQHPVQRA